MTAPALHDLALVTRAAGVEVSLRVLPRAEDFLRSLADPGSGEPHSLRLSVDAEAAVLRVLDRTPRWLDEVRQRFLAELHAALLVSAREESAERTTASRLEHYAALAREAGVETGSAER